MEWEENLGFLVHTYSYLQEVGKINNTLKKGLEHPRDVQIPGLLTDKRQTQIYDWSWEKGKRWKPTNTFILSVNVKCVTNYHV